MTIYTASRRAFLKRMAAVPAAAAAGSLINVVPATAQSPATVRMQLGWLASNGIIGEVVASAQGYYEEEGIALDITPGGPNVDGVASVASGRSNVGQLSSSPSLMLARSAGIPVKAFAVGYQKHPYTYFSLEGDPIRSAQDMVGKKIATQATGVILLRALLAANDIPESDVEIVVAGADMNLVTTGQASAITGWQTNINALKVLGDQRVDLMLWDAGVQLYANVYYATDESLENDAETLAGFVRGSARGWGFARQNPEAAVDMLVAAYPNLDKDSELEAMPGVLGFSFNEVTAENGWAAMDPANWERQIGQYADLEQFEGDVPTVDDVMTMDILDMTADIRKEVG